MNNETTTISTVEYCNLAMTSADYKTLTRAIINSSKLAYDRKSLRFDDEIICTLLKTMENYLYESRISDLQAAEECDSTTIKV